MALSKKDKYNTSHDSQDDTQTGVFPTVKISRSFRRSAGRTISSWSEFLSELHHNRRTNSIIISFILMLLGIAVGIGFMAQQRITDTSYSSLSEAELVMLLDETNNQVSRLQDQKAELSSQLSSIQTAADTQREVERVAKENQDANDILSGKVPATGPGVEITITQGGEKVPASTLYTVIEELRNAGAEVIQIGDTRVVTSTYIIDTDSGIISDGNALTSPYIIKAIGNKSNLHNAVEISGGIGSTLRAKYSANVEVVEKGNVKVTALAGSFDYKYAKTVE